MRCGMEFSWRAVNLHNQRVELYEKLISQHQTALFLVISQSYPQIFLNELMKDKRHRLSA